MEIERGNILAAARFVIRELLDYALLHQLSVVEYDDQNQDSSGLSEIVTRLLHIIENGVCHGINCSVRKSSTAIPLLDPWPLIFHLPGEDNTLVDNVSVYDDVKTGLGKTRLWIRNALMSKQLGSFILKFVEVKDVRKIPASCLELTLGNSPSKCFCIADAYAKGALLMSDEAMTFAGLLNDLNVIDFCFVLKDNLSRLDVPLVPIDYRSCINPHSGDDLSEEWRPQNELEQCLSSLIEQKSYLEEAVSTTQSRLGKVGKEVAALADENSTLRETKADMEAKISKLEEENIRLSSLLVRQSKEVQNELEVVRETFKHSSLSLDTQNLELERQLNEEKKRRLASEEARDAAETELSRLKELSSERETCLTEYRSQIAAMVTLNKEFSEKLRSVSAELEASNKHAHDLQEKIDGMSSVLTGMNERYNHLKEEKITNEKSLQEAIDQANRADQMCVQLQADLEANREFTQNLQSQLDEVYIDLASVKSLQENLDRKSQSLRERDAMIAELQQRCSEAERSLVEMAGTVEAARLQADRAEERVRLLATARWTSDSDVDACALCASPFSFSRRKHHCRNCGLIFCQECSAFKMSLPSSSKPVRVCETCHNQLMQRYSAR
ncbi:RUN and FYVE domain-containing protein 2 [Echinococcus granulosus]|uniref:RUN and FYVE domain-containing protein 2 n=2 Tax=Echinococcus granulosus TaxID=6210 RepID=W6U769_ECHGR|nr:RUN and FYVE domain-containing protein 2 [Echinococcus granulosus]EUB57025.1 RUN and FYVE domain-containing protein 2 [Echinococcus granulosus]KAH9282188.1 RUN and FYVE domain-containing protein 2 [Echinococcus granulosus]